MSMHIGERFGSLVVIERAENKGGRIMLRTICDCGNSPVVSKKNLRSGHAKSCGCARIIVGRSRATHGARRGGKRTPEYESWRAMMARCEYPNNNEYFRYGARGVRVCERWHDFALFLADIGPRPVGHSIDRINPYGDYCPENCRWADAKTQRANRRSSFCLNPTA